MVQTVLSLEIDENRTLNVILEDRARRVKFSLKTKDESLGQVNVVEPPQQSMCREVFRSVDPVVSCYHVRGIARKQPLGNSDLVGTYLPGDRCVLAIGR